MSEPENTKNAQPDGPHDLVDRDRLENTAIATGLISTVASVIVVSLGSWFFSGSSKPAKMPVRIKALEKEMVEFREELVATGEQGKQNETKIDKIIEMVRELNE